MPQALDFDVGEASGVECNSPRLPQLAHAVHAGCGTPRLLHAEDFKQRAVHLKVRILQRLFRDSLKA